MRKKVFSLLILSIFLLSGFAFSVLAQYDGGGGVFEGPIALIKKYIADPLFGGKALTEDTALLRMVFGLLLFSILFGASSIALGSYAKNTRIAISLLLALIAVIAVPANLLQSVAKLYGGVFIAFLLALPVVGGIYLMFKTFKDPTKVNYAIKFGIAFILFYVTGRFGTKGLVSIGGAAGTLSSGIFKGISSVMELASAAFLFLWLYYLVKIFTAEAGVSAGGEGIEGAAKQVESFKRGARRFRKAFRKGYKYERQIVNDLIKVKKDLDKSPPEIEKAKRKLTDARNKAQQMLAVEKYIVELENKAEQVANAEQKRDIKSKIQVFKNEITTSVPRVIGYIDNILKKKVPTAKLLDDAIKEGYKIEKAILGLEALEKEL